jgi:hypothetical protein
MIVRTDDYSYYPKGTHHEVSRQEPFREIRIRCRVVRRRNAHVRQAKAIDIFANVGITQVESAYQRTEQEVRPRREARVSAVWDMFIASILTMIFASLRIAIFFIGWLVLLMAVPAVIRYL